MTRETVYNPDHPVCPGNDAAAVVAEILTIIEVEADEAGEETPELDEETLRRRMPELERLVMEQLTENPMPVCKHLEHAVGAAAWDVWRKLIQEEKDALREKEKE